MGARGRPGGAYSSRWLASREEAGVRGMFNVYNSMSVGCTCDLGPGRPARSEPSVTAGMYTYSSCHGNS